MYEIESKHLMEEEWNHLESIAKLDDDKDYAKVIFDDANFSDEPSLYLELRIRLGGKIEYLYELNMMPSYSDFTQYTGTESYI